jgi:LysM domain
MPAGTNAGGQLNLLLFEVVAVTKDPLTGATLVATVGIHPLVRVPAQIAYSSTSRTAVTQTIGGAQTHRAPRTFLRCQMSGNWGVESVGLLPYIGTGEVRAQRFYNEVVCMSDAIERADVDACVNILTGTPLIKLLLAPYYAQPDHTSFAINFYDLWSGRKFQAVVRQFQETRAFRNGAGAGNIGYQMVIEEAGPIVLGSTATGILSVLFDGLTIWGDVNAVLESYNVQTVVNSALAIGSLLTTQVERTRDAVVSQIDAVTGLLGGASSSSNEALVSFLSDCRSLADTADQIAEAIDNARTPSVDAPQGGVEWSGANPDLPAYPRGPTTPSRTRRRSAAAPDPDAFSSSFRAALDESDALDAAEALAEAARWQRVAGKLFGFGPEEYAQLLASGGDLPRILGSLPYTVTDVDTIDAIEQLFGVEFDVVLAWNRLTPDEALVAGTVLQIPTSVTATQARRVEGLPVFGSQLGQAAWGADLSVDLRAQDGALVVVRGQEALLQGIDWLVEDHQDELLSFANALPFAGRTAGLAQKVRDIVGLDKRIVSVDDVRIDLDDTTSAVHIAATATVINGGTVVVGNR